MNVRAGLVKTKPTLQAEVLKQPIFNNPLVTNVVGRTLGVNGLNERHAITKVGCTKIKDLWDWEDREWKSLLTLGMNSHIINRINKNIIISNIPWNPVAFPSRFQTGNWISTKVACHLAPLTWIYQMMGVFSNLVKAIEFRKISPNDLIRVVSSQKVTLSPEGYHLIKVLSPKTTRNPVKVVRDFFMLPKFSFIWIFETNFIEGLP
jgi:hypothetical protein